MKTKTAIYLSWIVANILVVAGIWLTGIEIGSLRFGGVGWAWGSTVGYVLLIAAVVIMWYHIIRAERREA